jgi:hypothetical protein
VNYITRCHGHRERERTFWFLLTDSFSTLAACKGEGGLTYVMLCHGVIHSCYHAMGSFIHATMPWGHSSMLSCHGVIHPCYHSMGSFIHATMPWGHSFMLCHGVVHPCYHAMGSFMLSCHGSWIHGQGGQGLRGHRVFIRLNCCSESGHHTSYGIVLEDC